MPKAFPALVIVGLVALGGCQAFDLPPNQPALQLHYPPGFVADFPHVNPGDDVTVAAQVMTSRGEPVEGNLVPNRLARGNGRSRTEPKSVTRIDQSRRSHVGTLH